LKVSIVLEAVIRLIYYERTNEQEADSEEVA